VDDRETEATALFKHPRNLTHRLRQASDIMERHEGDNEVERPAGEGKRDGVGDIHLDFGIGLARQPGQRGRAVDADDAVAARLQVTQEATLAATEVEREPPWR
jgi:hypothetical protein